MSVLALVTMVIDGLPTFARGWDPHRICELEGRKSVGVAWHVGVKGSAEAEVEVLFSFCVYDV